MRINPLDIILYWSLKALKARDNRPVNLDELDKSRVRNILLVSTTAIGDTLFATPGIRALRRCFPQARITAHFNAKNMALFVNNPHIDEIVPYHRGYARFLPTVLKLRQNRPDLGLVFHGGDPLALPSVYLAGADYILTAHRSRKFHFLATRSVVPALDGRIVHAIENRLEIIRMLGCPADDQRMELLVDENEALSLHHFLNHQGVTDEHEVIGFQTGANDRYKIWPENKFIELGRRLCSGRDRVRIVITGSPAEAGTCSHIAREIGPEALSTAGKIDLKQLPPLIRRLAFLVTNDTGAMHAAFALGVRTVCLFCPTPPQGLGPLVDRHRHRIVQAPVPCQPCLTKRCREPFCMDQIEVETVYQACQEVWSENSPL